MAGAYDLDELTRETLESGSLVHEIAGLAATQVGLIHDLARLVLERPDVEPELTAAVRAMTAATRALERAGKYIIAEREVALERHLARAHDTDRRT